MERLTGLDATFLYVETPKMHMHVAMVAVLDPSSMPGGYSFERIQDLIASRVHRVPPLRRRILRVPLDAHHPLWVEDPDFDIIHHVRRVGVPAPGGPRELADLVGRINSTPLDRSRPLWEAWVVEGLERGRVALVAKVHHCAVDGVSGATLMVHLFSHAADTPIEPPPPPPPPEEIPSDRQLLREALAERGRTLGQLGALARRTAGVAQDLIRRRRDEDGPHGGTPLTAPRTHFNHPLPSARRTTAFARLPLAGVKQIKNAFGAKVNDVVLAITAGALRGYLDARGDLPAEPLVGVCPISVRASEASGSNQVSALFTSLATDLDDPVERLRVIHDNMRGAKEEHDAIGASMLQSWADLAAPNLFHLGARLYARMELADRHRPIHNLVVSNVPGPAFPIYLAGAELVAAYPMGPVLEGAGLNVTVMSYRDSMDFGFMACAELVPDLWDLAEAVAPAYDALIEAAGVPRRSDVRAPSTRV